MQKNTIHFMVLVNDAVALTLCKHIPAVRLKAFQAPLTPGGKAGDVLYGRVYRSVEYHVCGLNGGEVFKHSERFLLQIATTDDQKPRPTLLECDYWQREAQQVSVAGAKAMFGENLVANHPRVLTDAMASGGVRS